ncbi:nuclear transport factor 2 family protein [Euzebya sp.]|uniref:nuclear transport factor 2 family protein n=1 Tax=Euzebya sp. TaxID=1971409 RepID=UPI0035127829
MHPFRAAVEARDIEAAIALLADDVTFSSPVVFTPYQGRDAVGQILRAVIQVFEDFRYTTEIGGPDDADHALVFAAHIGDVQLEGVDLLHQREDGTIDRFTVMVRPLKAAHALAEAMAAKLGAKPPKAG